MSSSSHIINDELGNISQHATLLSKIYIQLLQGNCRHLSIWNTILKIHQTLETKTTESDIIMQELVPQIIAECEQGIEQNNSHAIILRASMYQHGQGSDVNYPAAINLYERAIILKDALAMSDRAYMHQHGQGGNVDYSAAIVLYEQAIDLGNAYAMNGRAYMHQYGQGGNVDYPAAIRLYEQAIDLGNAYAMLNRAYMHQNGQGGNLDYPAAILLYEQAIDLDNTTAMLNRAYMHQNGQGGNVDYSAAIVLYEQAIAFGNTTAIVNRAYMHEHGQGGNVDYPAAIRLYEQAIDLGNADAMNNRAYMHQYGQGGNLDYPAAILLYEQAIALGDTTAMSSRAYMHQYGQGGNVDYPAAIRLYEQAIDLGNTNAMNNRAYMHQRGQGGNVDYPAAIRLYEQAIDLGNTNAMNNRASMHENGQGGDVDYPAAIDLYERAITLGNMYAMCNYATMHARNHNSKQAARLFRQAAELGYMQAMSGLEDYNDVFYYRYHKEMLNRNYTKVIELMEQHSIIFNEFLEYDWPRFVNNLKQHEETAVQLASIFMKKKKNNNQDENLKQIGLLITLIHAESQQVFVSQSLNSALFFSINIWMLSIEQVEVLANTFIDACSKLINEQAAPIITLLSTLIQSISLNDLTHLYNQTSIIKKTVSLILELMYGGKISLLKSAEPSIQQLILLITNRALHKSSIAELNSVLPGLFQQTTPAFSSSEHHVFFVSNSEHTLFIPPRDSSLSP